MSELICAACGETVHVSPCPKCAGDPLLDGRYRLLSVVGRGGVGITYRAEVVADGTAVAIKEMAFRATDADDIRRLIEREARVLRQLNHPAIPKYIDDFIGGKGRNRAFYLVQAFIEGQDLTAESASHRYTVAEVLDVIDELCDVLGYLHQLSPPVIHRDVKPQNVMRRPDGSLVLLDFGAVRDAISDPRMGGNTIAGTFGYMAPEQFTGHATAATDLYGVGVLALVMLARRSPDEMMEMHTLVWRPHVQVHPAVEALLGWLLEADPKQRASNAAAVQRRLAEVRDVLSGKVQPEEMQSQRLPAPRAMVNQPTRPSLPTSLPMAAPGLQMSLTDGARARTKKMTFLLALIAGGVGGPWWYLGHKVLGVVSLMLAWTFVPWFVSVVKALHVYQMPDAEFDRRYNANALALLGSARFQRLSVAEEIERLHALVDSGALTGEQFERQKALLLGG